MLDANQLVGRTLAGKYQLVRLLGQGGMGMVFEGRNLELGKRVAIKLIDTTHAQSAELAARLRLEARAAATIESDAIVQVFDVGDDDSAGVFMVMEFLVGEDLSARIRREGRIDPTTTCTIAYSIARALARAHGAGVVHRDLKPANVFLSTREDGSLQVKLLDFGISKIVAEGHQAAGAGLTRMGTAIGTPHYMSPEQAQGLTDIDGRTDVWALGGVMYEMLTGQSAYPELATYEQTIVRILMQRPTPLAQALPGISPAIASIVEGALEHDLARRIPDASTFARLLKDSTGGPDRASASGGYASVGHAQPSGSQPRIAITPAGAAAAEAPIDLKSTLPMSNDIAAMYRVSPPVMAGAPLQQGTALGLAPPRASAPEALMRTLPMDSGASYPAIPAIKATTGAALAVASERAPLPSDVPIAGVPSSSGIAWKLGLAVVLLGGAAAAFFVVRGRGDEGAAPATTQSNEARPATSHRRDEAAREPKPDEATTATASAKPAPTTVEPTTAPPRPTTTAKAPPTIAPPPTTAPTTTSAKPAPSAKPSATAPAPTATAVPTATVTATATAPVPTSTGIPTGGISTAYPE